LAYRFLIYRDGPLPGKHALDAFGETNRRRCMLLRPCGASIRSAACLQYNTGLLLAWVESTVPKSPYPIPTVSLTLLYTLHPDCQANIESQRCYKSLAVLFAAAHFDPRLPKKRQSLFSVKRLCLTRVSEKREVGLDGVDDVAEDVADCGSKQSKDDDHNDRHQHKDQCILDKTLAFLTRHE
jgi:hypothetical protein